MNVVKCEAKYKVSPVELYVHGSVHRESMSIIVQQDATIYSLLFPANCSTSFG